MCGGDFVEVYNDPSQVGKRRAMHFLELIHRMYNLSTHQQGLGGLFSIQFGMKCLRPLQ